MTPELDYAFAMGFFVGSPERYQREMTKAERKSLANQYARIFNGRHHWKSREHLESICWRIRRRIEYTPPTRATVGRAQPEEAPKVQDAAKAPPAFLDGSSQEKFDASFDALLESMKMPDEPCSYVECLKCKHRQQDTDGYRCEKCGHNNGVMVWEKEPEPAQPSYLMVEGEGAPQYTFLPAQDAQLCLF